MIRPFSFVEEPPFNGEDGFGDADLPPIPTRVEQENAVQAIIRLAETYQGIYLNYSYLFTSRIMFEYSGQQSGQLTMVCMGPLTNLAVAVKIQPKLKNWLKDIYILGGNIEGIRYTHILRFKLRFVFKNRGRKLSRHIK